MSETPNPVIHPRRWPVYASFLAAFSMIICFAAVLTQSLLWLFPTLDTSGTLVVCALAVLEAFFSFWLIKRLPTAQRQIAYYRVTELVILLVAVKIFTELRAGPANLWNNFLLWPVQFPFNILTGQFLLTLLPVFAAWYTGNLFAADLFLLESDEAASLDDRSKAIPVRNLILRRFLNLGMFVVILAAIPLQNVFPTSLPASSNVVPAVLAYFVLGIVLLSLTRYITLETTWRQARLLIPIQVPRRWFAYSALILTALVLLISWLPTYYGMGLFDTINAVFHIIYLAFLTVYGFILLVIALLAKLFIKLPSSSQEQIPTITPPPENFPLSNVSTFNWELVKSVILWGGLIVLAIVALNQYIAYNRDLSADLRRFRPLKWLISVWDRLKASFKKANKSVGKFILNSINRLRKLGPDLARSGEWDYVNPRRLTPRQKIIFYYLALVRRAKEAGIPRQDGQTPYEYARALTSNLTEEKEDVNAMTESFIEARYSRHDIPAREARRAESIWETIRHRLQNLRRSRREKNPKDD